MAGQPGIRVPFYHQSYDLTCGPASLIMAMKHFDRKLAPSRELEIDIWREANLIEAYATSHYGLALAAHRQGFRARTQGNALADRLLDSLCRSCRIKMDTTSRIVECGLVARPVRILDHRLCLLLHPENRVFALSLLRDLQTRFRRAGIPNCDRCRVPPHPSPHHAHVQVSSGRGAFQVLLASIGGCGRKASILPGRDRTRRTLAGLKIQEGQARGRKSQAGGRETYDEGPLCRIQGGYTDIQRSETDRRDLSAVLADGDAERKRHAARS